MKLLINNSVIILIAILVQSCMMPFGMGGMHSSNEESVNEQNTKLMSGSGDYSQSLTILKSDSHAKSKYFIVTENLSTEETLNDYVAELNLYRIPFREATEEQIIQNVIDENIPFAQLEEGEQYCSYSSLEPGLYLININIYEIDGEELKTPLSFNYRLENNSVVSDSNGNFLGVNPWILGGAMVGMMVIMMTVVF